MCADLSALVSEEQDAERLQGSDADWTVAAGNHTDQKGPRWKLVGNVVSVPVAEWMRVRLLNPGRYANVRVGGSTGPLARCSTWRSSIALRASGVVRT